MPAAAPPIQIPGLPASLSFDPTESLVAAEARRVRELLAERARRRIDALSIYEPLIAQIGFHQSRSQINILRGSNRGGKTLPAAVEVARAVTGRDPYGKYPLADGRWYCVGKDLAHIGEVMFRKLWRPGAFKMIRDQVTGSWRSFRPWDASDLQRAGEARLAPPLIPHRLIRDIAWEDKKREIPSKVAMFNGWEINFYSSLGKPPKGSDLDGWWFDEEIVDPEWFPEMCARLVDRHGVGMWSATPQAGTEQLYELHTRAEQEQWSASPSVREHIILLAHNPHLAEDDKATLAKNLSEEDRRVRIGGEFALVGFRVYPEFNMLIHGVEMDTIPLHWSRYMVVDPGHQVCAVLFAAVPPPHEDNCVYLYDELYLRECDAHKFAVNVAERTRGQCIQASIIDPNMALVTELSSGKTVGRQYTEALEAEGFSAVQTNAGFILGFDDIAAGVMAVHGWLRMQEDGHPKLRVVKGRCPCLEEEFRRYVKQRQQGVILDKPNQRRNNHLMDDVRYLVLYNPRWIQPPTMKPKPSAVVRAFRAKQKKNLDKSGGDFVNLGPGRKTSG